MLSREDGESLLMTDSNEIDRIKEVYESRSIPDLKERGYLWHPCNPVSVYYRQAQERALISLINKYILQLETIRFLDIGCGTGNFLRFMLSLGAVPENLHGIDLIPLRIERARKFSPAELDLQVGNAMSLPFPDFKFKIRRGGRGLGRGG